MENTKKIFRLKITDVDWYEYELQLSWDYTIMLKDFNFHKLPNEWCLKLLNDDGKVVRVAELNAHSIDIWVTKSVVIETSDDQ